MIREEEAPVGIGEVTLLTDQERARIETAVREAEARTRGEIVPMVVGRSGLYREASHRAGLALAVCALVLLLGTESFWLPWGWHAANAGLLLLVAAVAYGAGVWVGRTTAAIRWLTTRERRRHKVRLSAERAFSQHGVGRTRERTGVLIMVSMLERQVSVLADRFLSERVPSQAWETVVAAIVPHLAAGRLAEGFCAGIERCGEILAQSAPPRPGDNPDELSNRVIQE